MRCDDSVVEKIDVDLDAVFFGSGPHECADVLRGTTTTSDDSTEIAIGDANLEDDDAVIIDCFHAN